MTERPSVPGVFAGHWTHPTGATGCTAFLFPEGAVAAVWVPGSATGSRELGALEPDHVTPQVHGIVISGGSAYGLSTADGVMAVLAEQGIGYDTTHGPVPIVPAAILYDLGQGPERPNAESGRAAAEAASSRPLAEGRVGAGAGATVAKFAGGSEPGGLGWHAESLDLGVVSACVAVNALGSVRDPETGAFVAGGGVPDTLVLESGTSPLRAREQTTLAVITTDVSLDPASCKVVAKMASAGLARTLYPAFSSFDGDVVFVASTGTGAPVDRVQVTRVGHQAATLLARAVVRAVSSRG